MNGIIYLFLIIFSVFTMNLTLQCAVGIGGIAKPRNYRMFSTILKLGIIMFSVIILWLFFTGIISSLFPGLLVYVLLFPVSFAVYEGFEYLIFFILSNNKIDVKKEESFIDFPSGITAVALFISLNIAKSFIEILILSLGFTLGILIVCIIVREINKRASLEAVPEFIRGKPLVVISMGLMSLIFSAGSLIILRMISIK